MARVYKTTGELFQQDHSLINCGWIVGDSMITQDDFLVFAVVFDKSFGDDILATESAKEKEFDGGILVTKSAKEKEFWWWHFCY